MARLRVIDIELADGQVQTILDRFFPGGPVAIIETAAALPAPAAVPERSVQDGPVAVPEPIAPLLGTAPRRAPIARKPKAAAPPTDLQPQSGDGIAARIPAVLPGTAREIATRLGASYAGVNWAIRAMRRRGQIVGAGTRGCVWSAPQTSAKPEAAPAAKPGDLKAFLLRELAKGPRDSGELMQAARKAGLDCPDRFAVDRILDSSEEVLGGHGSRWTLAHRAAVGE